MTAVASLIHRYKNLVAVPSAHYEPLFAQAVRRAMRDYAPSVVALESCEDLAGEWAWAAACWPLPVVSQAGSWFLPFVPGDSMLEAYRAAQETATPVAFIDVWLEAALSRSPKGSASNGSAKPPLVGVDLAPLLGRDFARLPDCTALFTARDLAREANMARRLRDLMRRHACVLWVGGAAHWARIVERLRHDDFTAPRVRRVKPRGFHRLRLGASALAHMTGRLPWHVRRFAEGGEDFDDETSTRALALHATRACGLQISMGEVDGEAGALGETHGQAGDDDVVRLELSDNESVVLVPESTAPVDAARVLLYARNLALARGVRQRPTFHELLTSATSVIGPAYAGILYLTAMDDGAADATAVSSSPGCGLPTLDWASGDGIEGFRCGGEWVAASPIWPRRGEGLRPIPLETVLRRARQELYRDLDPPREGEDERYWKVHPADGRDYILFVEYLLRRASVRDPEPVAVEPFVTGLGDGLDVRASLRALARGDDHLYVRRAQSGCLKFTNGVIDWRNDSEHDPYLQGCAGGGWIDPDYTSIGSASREGSDRTVLQEDPYHLQRDIRDFSLITLDLPTMTAQGPSFYDKVILPLVERVGGPSDTVYDWLDAMFAFCAGKPFAYHSRYAPSGKIHRLAARHGVTVVHFPLRGIPEALRERNRVFRYMALAPSQWEALRDRLGGD